MLWDDDEPNTRAGVLIKKINELKRSKRLLEITEGNALRLYEYELHEIRKNCGHMWGRPILLFNRHRRFCSKCELEDVAYRHQD